MDNIKPNDKDTDKLGNEGFRIDDGEPARAAIPHRPRVVRPGQSLNDMYRTGSARIGGQRPSAQGTTNVSSGRDGRAKDARDRQQDARAKGYGSYTAPASGSRGAADKADRVKRRLMIIIAVLLVLLIALGVGFAVWVNIADEKVEAERVAREAAELTLQQDLANSEFENLEQEFNGIENPHQMIVNDSVKLRLTEKYEAARLEVEKLQRELKNSQNKSAAEIADLRNQIATLRGLLKHYIEEIDRLNKENQALRTENAEIKDRNQQLTTQVEQTTRENKQLSERMTLAEKLNVTGVSLIPLNAKGRTEKKVTKARQLMVTFTIPQNNSTPVGEKTIYLRITGPEGQLLDGGGSFRFEDVSLAASARKTIEYGGQEIGGIRIYYDIRSALNPGTYTVELFADNYRLCSLHYNLK